MEWTDVGHSGGLPGYSGPGVATSAILRKIDGDIVAQLETNALTGSLQ